MRLAGILLFAQLITACVNADIEIAATPFPASTETPTPIATLTPLSSQTLVPTRARLSTPTSNPTRTPTRASGEILIGSDLNSEERRMIQDGLNLLKACAPHLFTYVRTHVSEVQRGREFRNATGYVFTGSSIVYLPSSGSVNDPTHYKDSMRTFVAATVLVHEARHIAMGPATTEPDAYQFELQVYVPACKPNDIGDAWNSQYEQLKHYVSWRASLSYPGEPPRNITPPPLRPP
ncbi:MAG: hypothetical protein HY327_01830 [Chloroflexi bacterium]|nr:hypothetical protein [Chloroflexota bacterium]